MFDSILTLPHPGQQGQEPNLQGMTSENPQSISLAGFETRTQ